MGDGVGKVLEFQFQIEVYNSAKCHLRSGAFKSCKITTKKLHMPIMAYLYCKGIIIF